MQTIETPERVPFSKEEIVPLVRPICYAIAYEGRRWTYGDVVTVLHGMEPERFGWRLDGDPYLPANASVFHEALGMVSQETLRTFSFAITCLIVNKGTGRPGNGFYALCGAMEKPLVWEDEVTKTLAYFGHLVPPEWGVE